MSLSPYIFFKNQCREAITFYETLFGGRIITMMTFAEAPPDAGATGVGPDQIMHTALKLGDDVLMASDSGAGDFRPMQGSSLAFTAESVAEAERIWRGLSEDAEVIMEMAETFWAERFGMLTDRFGIRWMIQFPKPM